MNKYDIIKQLNKIIKDEANSENSSEHQDLISLHHLKILLKEDKFKEAYDFFWSLDTFVRDCLIPEDVFDFITLNRNGKKDKKVIYFTIELNLSELGIKDKVSIVAKDDEGNIVNKDLNFKLIFPSDATFDEMSMAICRYKDEICKKIINLKVSEPRIEIFD
jgi:hypothetical protein